MLKTYTYKPLHFFALAFLMSWLPWFFAVYASWQPSMQHLLFPLVFLGLSAPALSTLIMLLMSRNNELWYDFFQRLRFASIKRTFIPVVLLLFPCLMMLAITISLFFGQPLSQLSLITQATDLLLQGKSFLITLFILFLIGPFEEIGWRGYGIDSLREKYTLMKTSLIFGTLWAVWHVPLFFIKNGGLQQEIWDVGLLQTFIYFSGLFLISFLTNWLYEKNNRSILTAILFHSSYDTCLQIFHMTPVTWIILWLLALVAVILVVYSNKNLFFSKSSLNAKSRL